MEGWDQENATAGRMEASAGASHFNPIEAGTEILKCDKQIGQGRVGIVSEKYIIFCSTLRNFQINVD